MFFDNDDFGITKVHFQSNKETDQNQVWLSNDIHSNHPLVQVGLLDGIICSYRI